MRCLQCWQSRCSKHLPYCFIFDNVIDPQRRGGTQLLGERLLDLKNGGEMLKERPRMVAL